MPGSVLIAAPTTVLPASLSRTFARDQEWPVLVNEYRRGEPQTGLLGNASRKRWHLVKRLTPGQMGTLYQFWTDRNGGMEPFYFYDPYETNPRFTSDPTGATMTGRYAVRFDSSWSQSCNLGRGDVEIVLVEVA